MPRRIVIAVLILAATVPAAAQGPETNPPQNVAIVEAMFKYVNQRNFDMLEMVIAEDVVRHSGARAEVAVDNRKDFMKLLKTDLEAVPDAAYDINLIFGGEDMVALHATYMGTQVGPMEGHEATGKRIELPFMGIMRIEGGMIAEIWFEWDNMTVSHQIGHGFGE